MDNYDAQKSETIASGASLGRVALKHTETESQNKESLWGFMEREFQVRDRSDRAWITRGILDFFFP